MPERKNSEGHAQPWDVPGLIQALDQLEYMSHESRDKLRFELSELAEAVIVMHRRIEEAAAALSKQQATPRSWVAVCELIGELEHMRHHVREAVPILRKLTDQIRKAPPLDSLSDEELSERAVRAARQEMANIRRRGSRADR